MIVILRSKVERARLAYLKRATICYPFMIIIERLLIFHIYFLNVQTSSKIDYPRKVIDRVSLGSFYIDSSHWHAWKMRLTFGW